MVLAGRSLQAHLLGNHGPLEAALGIWDRPSVPELVLIELLGGLMLDYLPRISTMLFELLHPMQEL